MAYFSYIVRRFRKRKKQAGKEPEGLKNGKAPGGCRALGSPILLKEWKDTGEPANGPLP